MSGYDKVVPVQRVKVKIANIKILEWLIFRIWKWTNMQMYNGRTYESHYNRKWNLYQRVMKIGKIANGAEYRLDEQFQNLLIFWILIIFQI